MTINIANNTPRVSYTVGQGVTQTSFAVSFEFFAEADLNFYVDGTLKTITTHYTVSGGNGSTGTITSTVVGASGGSTVLITRSIELERTTDFPSSGAFQIGTLNTELDRFTAQLADRKDQDDRSIRLADSDEAVSMTLPTKSNRAGKVLGFNSSDGTPEATQQVTGAAVNVSGLSAGASPTASVSVSGGTATFALGIPAGAAGAAGSTGNTGSQGPQGPAGAAGDNTISVKDEGSALSTAASTLNFVGSGVTASGTGAEKTVTITDTDTTYSVGDGGLTQNNFTNTLKSKLDGIEASATADQSNAEIKSAYEANSNTNAFSDAEKTKLSGISSSANNYSLPTASGSTLGGIKIGSGLSIDGSGVVTSSGGGGGSGDLLASNNLSDVASASSARSNLGLGTAATTASTAYATAAQGTKADAALPKAGGTMTGDIDGGGNKVLFANVYSQLSDLPSASTYHGMFAHVHSSGKAYFAHGGNWIELANNSQIPTVGDGGLTQNNFTNTLKSKLDAIEASATADQTAAEIRTLVESASDSNVFTDADHTKLNGVAASSNNYVHPNHSGEVTSAADGATVVADNVIDEANLKVSNSPTNGYALTAQSGNTGGLTWAAISGGSYTHPNHSGEVTSTGDGATVIADNVVDEANLKVSNSPTNGYFLQAQSGNTGGLTWAAASGGGGSGADLYAANESSPAAQPSATGGNAVAVGDNAIASGDDAIALGTSRASGAQSFAAAGGGVHSTVGAQGGYSIAIGYQTMVTTAASYGGVAIGFEAQTHANYGVAIGQSRASGVQGFSLNIENNGNSYGATATHGIAMGKLAKATATSTIAIGENSTGGTAYAIAVGYQANATGAGAIAIGNQYYVGQTTASGGGSIAIGDDAKATQKFATAIGSSSSAAIIGKYAYAGGRFAATGDSQGGQFILRADTTDATATVLTTNNSTAAATNQIVAASDTCITFDGTIVAMQNGADAYASWRIEGLLVNDGGTTTLANSAITVIYNQSSWGMALTADNTNNALAITVTGEASHNIRWVANIRTSEVTYA